MPLNLNSDNLIVVAKHYGAKVITVIPDPNPITYTGYSRTIIIGSGVTTATNVSGTTWIINTPATPVTLVGSGATTAVNTSGSTWTIYTPHEQYTGDTTVIIGSGGTWAGLISGDTWVVYTPDYTQEMIDLFNLENAFTGHTGTTSIHTPYSAITQAISAATSSLITGATNGVGGLTTLTDNSGQTIVVKGLSIGGGLLGINDYGPGTYVEIVLNENDVWNNINYHITGISITESQVINLISDLSGKTSTGTTYQLEQDFLSHTGNTYIHQTSGDTVGLINNALQTYWDSGETMLAITGYSAPIVHSHPQYTLTGTTHQIQLDLTGLTQSFDSHSGDSTIHFTKSSINLDDLGDVAITAPTDGSLLMYSGGTWRDEPAVDIFAYVSDQEILIRNGDEVSGITNEFSLKVDKSTFTTYTGTTAPLQFAAKVHTHAISGVTGLQTALDGKTNTGTTHQIQLDLTGLTSSFETFTGDTQTLYNDVKEETGFINGSAIDVSYSYSARTVTLTGDLTYYWRGVKHVLSSPWTSTGHTASGGTWFLSTTDGLNFTWSQNIWSFSDIQVAYLYYTASSATTFCIKETHETLQHDAHETLHKSIGTIRSSGGAAIAGTYAFNTATDVATTPDFSQAVVRDEDLDVTIPQVDASGYTRMYVTGGTVSVFTYAQNFPFYSTGSYIQVNNAITGAMTNGVANRWYNVYQILVPVASDTTSQKFRMIFLQPQATYTSLASALAEDTRGLYLGSLTSQSAEYVFYARITYNTANANGNTGKVTIPTGGLTYVVGNKMSQVSIAGVSATDHANLGNLTWDSSGHISSNNYLAAFDSSGNAVAIPKDTYSLSGHTHAQYLTGVTWNDITSKPDLWTTGETMVAITGYSAPIIHTHAYSAITDLPDLSLYQPVSGMSLYQPVSGMSDYYTSIQVDGLISGFTTGYTFVASGGTAIGVLNNQITIYSPTGSSSNVVLVGSGATVVDNISGDTWVVYSPTGGTGGTVTLVASGACVVNNVSGDTWIIYAPSGGTGSTGGSLATLTDVSLSAVTHSDVLQYNSGTTKWENEAPIDIFANVTDRQVLVRSGSTIVSEPMMHVLRTTANQTINAGAATFVDVTDLTFPVVSGTSYAFFFYVTFKSAAATTGWKMGVNCPTGTLDFWAGSQTIANGAAGVATHTERHNVDRDDMTLLTATVTANVDLANRIEGRYLCTQDGTFACRFANELAADTNIVVQKGSYGWWF